VRDEPVKDAAQGMAEDVTQDVAEDVLGAAEDGSAKALSPRFPWATREGRAREGRGTGRCGGRCGNVAATAFVQLTLRFKRNWAAQWHLARAEGKHLRGCRAMHLYVYNRGPWGGARGCGFEENE